MFLDESFGLPMPLATTKIHLSEEVLYTSGGAEPEAGNSSSHKYLPSLFLIAYIFLSYDKKI